MSLQRWILMYLAAGPSFTRLAALAFHGGGVLVVAAVVLATIIIVADAARGLFG